MDDLFDKPDMFYRLVEKAMPFTEDRGRFFFTMDGVERKLYMRSRFHSEDVEDKALSMKDRPPAMKRVYRLEITFVIEDYFRFIGDYPVVDGSDFPKIMVNVAAWRHSILSTYDKTREELEHVLLLLSLQ